MKRFIALIGIALVLIGVRYYDGGIYNITGGKLTAQNYSKTQLFIPSGNDNYRIDLDKDYNIDELIKKSNATIKLVEQNIIYAYSPLIKTSVFVHGKRVNMMIHKGKSSINVGIPLLTGSF